VTAEGPAREVSDVVKATLTVSYADAWNFRER
jgi:hypothetical protein